MMPVVSVVIPVHNGEATISRTIDSALQQRYGGEVEIVVVNDGSTDETVSIVDKYRDRYRGRISLLSRATRGGVSAATNTGVRASKGDYVAFLHADDTWMPEKLARTIPELERDPGAVLVYHDANEFDDSERITKRSHYPKGHTTAATHRDLLKNRSPSTLILLTTVVMRRTTFEQCGGFAEELTSAEDLWMWLRASEYGHFCFVPEVLASRRFELTTHREQWYVEGVRCFEVRVRERYGAAACGNYLATMLVCFGLVAMARGERQRARTHYLAALRCNPASLKTWVRLAWSAAPDAVTGTLSRVLSEAWLRSLNGPPSSGVFSFDIESNFARKSPGSETRALAKGPE